MGDLDTLREIPGYKAILKSVLKMQIQMLLEQLSNHTAEESIILTASVNDGTLSHLGSSTGKGFLEGRDEIKSQFLGYCLKSHHRQKNQDTRSPYHRPHSKHLLTLDEFQPTKRSRSSSFSPTPASIPQTFSTSLPARSTADQTNHQQSTYVAPSKPLDYPTMSYDMTVNQSEPSPSDYKLETGHDNDSQTTSLSTSRAQEATLVSERGSSGSVGSKSWSDNNMQGHSSHVGSVEGTAVDLTSEQVKIEPISEQDLELEITGVEVGNPSMSSEGWNPFQSDPGSLQDPGFSNPHDSTGGGYGDVGAGTSDWTPESTDANLNAQNTPNGACICTYCGKGFQRQSWLARHLRTHTGEQPFKCDMCDKAFKQKGDMKRHRFVAHVLQTVPGGGKEWMT